MRSFQVRVYFSVSYGCVGLRFFRVKIFFAPWGLLILLTIGEGLGFFGVLRSLLVRVYLRVGYGFVGLRFFFSLELFRA